MKLNKLGLFINSRNQLTSIKQQGKRVHIKEFLNADRDEQRRILKKKLGLSLANLNNYIRYDKNYLYDVDKLVDKLEQYDKNKVNVGITERIYNLPTPLPLPVNNQQLINNIRNEIKANNEDVIRIQLEYFIIVEGDRIYAIKGFEGHKYKNIKLIYKDIISWSNSFQNGDDYIPYIVSVYIDIVRENAGGCNNSTYNIIELNGIQLKSLKSKNNNCFFTCIKELCYLEILTKKYCNDLRNKIGIEADTTITISNALELFKYLNKDEKKVLKIINNEEGSIHYSYNYNETKKQNIFTLYLLDNHYYICIGNSINICNACNMKYKKQHTCAEYCVDCLCKHRGKCNSNRANYFKTNILKQKNNFITYRGKSEKYNKDNIIHYDIETYLDNVNSNIPYIVGFVYNDNKFQYFSGDDCLESFVEYILEIAKEHKKLYINAYNGSNFDHFKLYDCFTKLNVKETSPRIINNNSLMKATFGNIEFIDLWRHCVGSLKSNLKSFGCKIQKGDFDHSKHKRWEEMDVETKNDCLKYLEGDVLGLKELYDKLSYANYQHFGSNLLKVKL